MDIDLNSEVGVDEIEPLDPPVNGNDDHVNGALAEDYDREAGCNVEAPINLDPLAPTTAAAADNVTSNEIRSPGKEALSVKDAGEVSAAEADDNLCRQLEKRLAIGSLIRDLDEAYVLYCEYGRVKGFGVRKGEQRYIGRSDTIKWKEYNCCCAGFPDGKASRDRLPGSKKLLLRCGCKAKVRVSRSSGSLPWHVSNFVMEHNHGLVASEMTYMLRSSRNLSTANSLVLEALHASGIGISGAVGFMEKQCSGPEFLGFTRRDAYEHFARKRKNSLLENSDSSKVMQYFRDKANAEPFYYWNAQTDDEGRLVNLFFRDMRSADDYRAFGDVLSLDSTYRTNMYNLICVPFVGINHHTFTILFGVGFLSDETSTSFEWLFREFLKSMNGVEPKVIFTDQCLAMMKAIRTVFPTAKHHLSQWHINRNAAKKFGALNDNHVFQKLWYRCMKEVETEHEFDTVWKQIMCYATPNNAPWFNSMYNLRWHWAAAFTRGIFTAGLLGTSRSEGTNRDIKSVSRHSMTLFDIVNNYEQLNCHWRRREKEEDMLGTWKPGQLANDSPLFAQAASLYTRNVYMKFESEASRIFALVVPPENRDIGNDTLEFTVTNTNSGRSRKVTFNSKTFYTWCSCRKWEAEGVFCRHIVKVYSYINHFTIPESQILKRWTKKAKGEGIVQKIGTKIFCTLPYHLSLQMVVKHIYEMGCRCDGDEEDQSFVLERLEKVRTDLFNVIGLGPVKQKRKVLHDLNPNEVSINASDEFFDPKVVEEKGFAIAREMRSLQTKQGTRESKGGTQADTSSLPPRIHSEMEEHFPTSPTAYPPHSAGWAAHNPQFGPASQP